MKHPMEREWDLQDAILEIASLRAEVGRFKDQARENYGAYKEMERERDEALAQVALLVELCERVMAAEDPDEYERDLEIMLNGDRIAQARTLLDRLQRAEAVVAAFKYCEDGRGAFSCCEKHDCRCPKSRASRPEDWNGEWRCKCGREELDQALAAWEEGKA